MGNVGRVFCVALPFMMVVASIICLLIGGLIGVTTNSSLYMFRVNTTDLSISSASVENLLKLSGRSPNSVDWHEASVLDGATSSDTQTSNITAADLGLADLYDINLWGYCYTNQNGNRTCTKAQFDWAETYLNTTSLTSLSSAATGTNITLPTEITSSLNAFKTVTKWTEVVFIIAMIALGVELFFGLFTSCSRAVSCLTWVISGIATTAAIGAAALMTAMSAIVVGAVESTAKWYGVSGSLNTSFLAVIWLGVAFAIGAGLFWMLTVCCCKPDHRSNKRNLDEQEKFVPTGTYAPLHDRNSYGYNNQYSNQYGTPQYGAPQYGAPRQQNSRSDLAYEPYSHHNNV